MDFRNTICRSPIVEGSSKKFIEGNIRLKGPIPNFMRIASYFLNGPQFLGVREIETSEELSYEPIFRIRENIPNVLWSSWSVYSRDQRESFGSNGKFFLREVCWHLGEDINIIRNSTAEERRKIVNCWPDLHERIIFLSEREARKTLKAIKEIDKVILNGLNGNEKKTAIREEKEMVEIMRLFEWGSFELNWTSFTKKILSKQIDDFHKAFKENFKNSDVIVEEITSYYDLRLEDYKNYKHK